MFVVITDGKFVRNIVVYAFVVVGKTRAGVPMFVPTVPCHNPAATIPGVNHVWLLFQKAFCSIPFTPAVLNVLRILITSLPDIGFAVMLSPFVGVVEVPLVVVASVKVPVAEGLETVKNVLLAYALDIPPPPP